MKLYLGNKTAGITTLLLIGLIGWIAYTLKNRAEIRGWGGRVLALFAFGLVVCCFAAARDGLDRTIQCAIDGSCDPGMFPLVSIPTAAGCIGAAVIVIAALAALVSRSQHVREICFAVMSGGMAFKIAVIELSRLIIGG